MKSPNSELPLAPLGAGDLIDRAVRLYRRHFLTLIGIAAPPVVLSALGSTITTISWRELTATSSEINMALYVLMLMAGIVTIISGSLFSIIVMGGNTLGNRDTSSSCGRVNSVFLFSRPHGLRAAGHAGRRQNGFRCHRPQLLSCQWQCSPLDGHDIVYVFLHLLCSNAVDDSAGMV